MTSPLAGYIVWRFFLRRPSGKQFWATIMHGPHRKSRKQRKGTLHRDYVHWSNVAIWGSLPQVNIFGNNSLSNLLRVYAVSQPNEAAVVLLYVGQTHEMFECSSSACEKTTSAIHLRTYPHGEANSCVHHFLFR